MKHIDREEPTMIRTALTTLADAAALTANRQQRTGSPDAVAMTRSVRAAGIGTRSTPHARAPEGGMMSRTFRVAAGVFGGRAVSMRTLLVVTALASICAVLSAARAEPARAADSGGSVVYCPATKPYARLTPFGDLLCSYCPNDSFEACGDPPDAIGDVASTEIRAGESLYLTATSVSGTTFDYAFWAEGQRLDCAASTVPIGTSTVTCAGTNSVARTLSVVVDGTAPTVACAVPAQETWYASDVAVPCTASDAGSGLSDAADASFSLSTAVAVGTEIAAAATGSASICDRSGNCAPAGPYAFKVDREGPSVACGSAPSFLLNQTGATVGAAVTDGGSGPASPTVTTAADTSSVGAKTASLTGHDNVGNSTVAACPYQVDYRFGGFSAPVDMAPTVNVGKAGKTYPVKWRLSDANDSSIDSLAAVRGLSVAPTSCSSFTSAPTDVLESTATGGTSLRYDSAANQYVYNWATPPAGCYMLLLELSSGQLIPAYFKLS